MLIWLLLQLKLLPSLSFNLSHFSKDMKEFGKEQLWHIYFSLEKDKNDFGEG